MKNKIQQICNTCGCILVKRNATRCANCEHLVTPDKDFIPEADSIGDAFSEAYKHVNDYFLGNRNDYYRERINRLICTRR
jgi:hypothetical protein